MSCDTCVLQQSLSNGEIQAGSHDPFKKLLDKLNSSGSSSDSTTLAPQDEEKDNTLSEVTSFVTQEDITTTISSPPPPGGTTATATDAIRNETSPGEITRNISVLPVPLGDEPSLGEVNSSQKVAKMSRSPGEVPPILRASETRDGIDVIRIAKWSDKLRAPNDNSQQPSAAITSESQYLMEQFDSSEIIQISTSRSSINTRSYSNGSSQLQHIVSHMNTNDVYTESQVLPSSPTKSHTVEEVNRKVVTINIPDTTTGFYSEDTSTSNNKELSTEMTFTISSLSSENF